MKELSKDDMEEARRDFDREIANVMTIKFLVFGDGEDETEIAKMAEVREKARPEDRIVIWVKNPDFLSKEEKLKYKVAVDDLAVCVLDFYGNPVQFLTREEAKSYTNIEIAF